MSKLQEAIAIFIANLVLFSLIILSVRFPANILVQVIILNLPPASDEIAKLAMEFRINNLLSAIFDPIYIGAIVYCLWQLKQGRNYNYSQAMIVGLQNWGKLFTVRFIAGLFIILGTIALIVPGIILALRYALTEAIVIVEGYGKASTVLKRSATLTKGRKIEILGVTFVALILIIVLSFLLYSVIDLLKISSNVFSEIILSSLTDVIIGILTIIMFLFYWQARTEEQNM